MDRRKFLKDSCKVCILAGIGMFTGATILESCGELGTMALLKTNAVAGSVKLPLTDFAVHKTRLVRVGGYDYDIAVRELGVGKYIALLMKCTHAGQPLTKTGNGFYCTLHGSRFSPTGKVENGPAAKPMAMMPLKVVGQSLEITLIDASKV